MAFAALISVRNTMERFANFLETVQIPYMDMEILEEIIEKLDEESSSKTVKALERQIREALHGLEDAADSVRTNMTLISQSDQSIANERHAIYVEEIRRGISNISSFFLTTMKIQEEYSKEFEEDDSDDDDDDDEEELLKDDDDDYDFDYDDVSSRSGFGGKRSKLVGVCDQLTKIKDELTAAYKSYELRVVSFVGVAGTGRSYVASNIFDRIDSVGGKDCLFKLRAWVSIGQKYEFKNILVEILSYIDNDDKIELVAREEDEKIFEYLYTRLKSGRFFIVLDDVWETGVWEYLKKLFPDENNGSRVFLTTHLEEVALFAKSVSMYPTRALKKEESWNLLSTVLSQKRMLCHPEFEKAGKKIAENCRGLQIEVAKVAILLFKCKKPEQWKKVAEDMETSVAIAKDAYDEISEISKISGEYISARGGSSRIIEKVLGLPSDFCLETMDNEFLHAVHPNFRVVSLVGMAGIGKTALAREIFEDPWTLRCYEHRVWLTLGPGCGFRRILADILAQLDPTVEYKKYTKENEAWAKQIIRSILCGKRCLIVLDNAWKDMTGYLTDILGDIKCEVLLTTRVLTSEFRSSRGIHKIPFLNKEESWNLLREEVFGEDLCPGELEKAGKMIAEECDGLPLTIITVASLLSKADEKTQEYWNDVANEKNSVFEDAYHKISKSLYPSYKHLGLEYRACFLYMAAFRRKYEIPISKLFMLCTVEGLLPSNKWNLIRDFISLYLGKLDSQSLVLIHDNKYNGQAKTCRLHSVFWHFCVTQARNDKFLHVIKRYADGLPEAVDTQRRLCIQNNVLFAIKDVYNSMASVSTARSLLCFGPPHQYQVPICCDLHLNWLKVLDALAIRFFEFPDGIFRLILLRYLALTYDGKLSDSISKLWNLEFLNIQQNMSIRFPGDSSYLPMEIWEMKELKHLQIRGRNLPDDPRQSRARLDKLSTLSDVRAESCTKSILERIPNLAKLGIRIELEPNAFNSSSFSSDCISHLKRLKSLKCVVVNPELKSVISAPFPMLPSHLNKLSLSGLGYSWEQMRPIAFLPYLLVLKLKCYAFQGAEWVMHQGDFDGLKYLLLEDADLVHWRAHDYCRLNSLQLLIIRYCFKLKDIPWHSLPPSCKVQLVDCNPSALDRMPENYSATVYTSWEVTNYSRASAPLVLRGHKL